MSIWKLIFGGNFSEDAIVLPSAHVQDLIRRVLGAKGDATEFDLSDEKYVALTRDNLDAMVYKSVRLDQIRYRPNRGNFPDCDDYAIMARGKIIREAISDGFWSSPCFFIAIVTRDTGDRHVLNIALDASSQGQHRVRLYDPQNNSWDSSLARIVSVDKVIG